MPNLLAMFAFGSLAVVGAVVAVAAIDSDWADAGAIALVIAISALLGTALARALRDDN
jgi:hypothetical protein